MSESVVIQRMLDLVFRQPNGLYDEHTTGRMKLAMEEARKGFIECPCGMPNQFHTFDCAWAQE